MSVGSIDLLAILQKSLDRGLFLYNFIREGSIEWRWSFDRNYGHSKILHIVMRYRRNSDAKKTRYLAR